MNFTGIMVDRTTPSKFNLMEIFPLCLKMQLYSYS